MCWQKCQQHISETCADENCFNYWIIKEQNNKWRIVMNITSFIPYIWPHFPKWSLLYPACCNYKIKTVISVSQVCLSWALLELFLCVFKDLARYPELCVLCYRNTNYHRSFLRSGSLPSLQTHGQTHILHMHIKI